MAGREVLGKDQVSHRTDATVAVQQQIAPEGMFGQLARAREQGVRLIFGPGGSRKGGTA